MPRDKTAFHLAMSSAEGHRPVDLVGVKRNADKGRAHEFQPHEHEALILSHGHSHVVHYRAPGERDEWQHLTYTHEHEHNHAHLVHMHTPHAELQLEHVHEAHVHDHDSPAA